MNKKLLILSLLLCAGLLAPQETKPLYGIFLIGITMITVPTLYIAQKFISPKTSARDFVDTQCAIRTYRIKCVTTDRSSLPYQKSSFAFDAKSLDQAIAGFIKHLRTLSPSKRKSVSLKATLILNNNKQLELASLEFKLNDSFSFEAAEKRIKRYLTVPNNNNKIFHFSFLQILLLVIGGLWLPVIYSTP